MAPTVLTAFRLTLEDLALLDIVQADRGFRSRAETLRFVIRDCIERLPVGSSSWSRAARVKSDSPGQMREAARLFALVSGRIRSSFGRKLSREERARSKKIAECLLREAGAWERERKAERRGRK